MVSGRICLFMVIVVAIAQHAHAQLDDAANKTKNWVNDAAFQTKCSTSCIGYCKAGDFTCINKCGANCKLGIEPSGATALKISGVALVLHLIFTLVSKNFTH